MVDLAGSIRANATAMDAPCINPGGTRRSRDQPGEEPARGEERQQAADDTQKLNRSGMCWTIVLVIVGFVFAWTCVYVRVTSDKVRRIG